MIKIKDLVVVVQYAIYIQLANLEVHNGYSKRCIPQR